MRNTVCLLGAVCFAATVSVWTDRPVHGQVCAGDCNGDLATTINELITCVAVALDSQPVSACHACDLDADGKVVINELVAAVQVAINTFAAISASGQCLQPCMECGGADANGLVPCTEESEVQVSTCDADGTCTQSGAKTKVQGDGMFSLGLCLTGASALQFTAEETGFRVIDLGSAAAPHRLRATAAGLDEPPASLTVNLSPASEAVVRLLTATGLSQFDDAGVEQVTAAVEAALADTNFAGQDAAAAASTATATAGAAPLVQQTIENNRGIVVRIGQGTGVRGGTTQIGVTLGTGGIEIAGTQNDIMFTADARIAALPDGTPDCAVNPAIRKAGTTFSFTPPDCSGTACTGMRAIVLDFSNTNTIAQGAELYTCTIAISPQAPTGSIPLTCGGAIAASPDGTDMDAQCTAGAVTVTN